MGGRAPSSSRAERSAPPALTSIRFKNEEAGVLTAKTLISMIRNEPVSRMQTIGYEWSYGDSVLDRTKKD